MYLRGRVTLDLEGTEIKLRPPSNFFGGVANLMTKGKWQTREEMETYKLLAFAQSANRAMMDLGVSDVVRVSIGKEVIYEDLENRENDFGTAMEALQAKIDAGFDPDPHSGLELVLKHDDGILNYVIDLDFVCQHKKGQYPVSVTVTAIPSGFRRLENESETEFQNRLGQHFQDQAHWDESQDAWDRQLNGFLGQIADHFRTNVGVENVKTETRNVLPRRRDSAFVYGYAGYGYPLYGYNPGYDLAYLLMWDSMWSMHDLRFRNAYYGYGNTYVYTGDSGVGYSDAAQYDATHPVSAAGTDFGGSDSGGGGFAAGSDFAGSDSGGGGWLNSVGDFSNSGGGGDVGGFGGSDFGGGGDVGGGSSCASASCSACIPILSCRY